MKPNPLWNWDREGTQQWIEKKNFVINNGMTADELEQEEEL